MIPKDEKEREKVRKTLRKTGDVLLKQVREIVDNAVFLCDVDAVGGLVDAVHIYLDHRLMETIRSKGFSKEFSELCDKIGRSG